MADRSAYLKQIGAPGVESKGSKWLHGSPAPDPTFDDPNGHGKSVPLPAGMEGGSPQTDRRSFGVSEGD